MWQAYLATRGETPERYGRPLSSWHFCDKEQDTDECVRLVLAGRKQATSPSLWSFEGRGEPLPRVGDEHVVTNCVYSPRPDARMQATMGRAMQPDHGQTEAQP